jgi:hypothetical protein
MSKDGTIRGVDEVTQVCKGTILHDVEDYTYEVGGIVIDADGKEYLLPDIYSEVSSNYTQQLMQADIGDLHDTSTMEQDVPAGPTDAYVFGAVRQSGEVVLAEKMRRAAIDAMADTFPNFVVPATSASTTSDAVAVSTSNDVATSNKPTEISDPPIVPTPV